MIQSPNAIRSHLFYRMDWVTDNRSNSSAIGNTAPPNKRKTAPKVTMIEVEFFSPRMMMTASSIKDTEN